LNTHKHDIVILGSGLAGMRAALEASVLSKGKLNIAIVTKLHAMRSHSVAAEGGISGVLYGRENKDSEQLHAYDTIKGSDYLADQDAVQLLVQNAPKEIMLMDHLGVPWNKDKLGRIKSRAFGGMSIPRTAFAEDKTGFFLMSALYDNLIEFGNIEIFHEYFATKLIMENNSFRGLSAIDLSTGEFNLFTGKSCIIATGGHARMYGFTTTSHSSTGDGTALAYNAGASLKDMEFVQFHPTALVPNGILISEASRGEGAYLINAKGERFMKDYASSKMELAPRDIISRAIISEIRKGNGFTDEASGLKYVGLDLRHLGRELVDEKLPMVGEITESTLGLDPVEEVIPVRPAAHFTMGGINTNIKGEIIMHNGNPAVGLWAAGECGCVSIHGANRLGSNSLSQCLVWGNITGTEVTDYTSGKADHDYEYAKKEAEKEEKRLEQLVKSKGKENPYKIRTDMQNTMDTLAYVYKNEKDLASATKKLKSLRKRFSDIKIEDGGKVYNTNLRDALEISNLLELAYAVLNCASKRKESRGAHAMEEYPKRNDKDWLKHTIVSKNSVGEPEISYIPVKITKWKPEERKY
jgi:succinate dehydrogenase / fumarate reductase, flavoprotein subunit